MLLAVFEERRPTRDVDLIGMAIANDADSVAALVTEITTIEVDDGVVFRPEQLTTQTIREQDVYAAGRVTRPAAVATAEVALKVDVNVGDPVTPAPVEVTYPALLDEPFTAWARVSPRPVPGWADELDLSGRGPGLDPDSGVRWRLQGRAPLVSD